MNSFLLALSALLILAISALFAAPLFIDWNEYRPVFEAKASELLGRAVKVEGPVHLVILPAPEFRFDALKVADRNGSFEKPFLEARSVEALISIGALMTGKVEARTLSLQDPVLRLDIGADGAGNWSDLGTANAQGAFVPKAVSLDAVTISNGTVEIAKEGSPQFILRAVEGAASASSLTGPYKVTASYDYEGRRQELGFSTNAPDAAGLFRLKAVLRDQDRRATYLLDGGVSGLASAPAYDGKFTLRIAENNTAETKTPPAAEPAAPVEPVAREGTVSPDLPEVAVTGVPVSAFELKGDLKATLDHLEIPAFDATIHARGRPQLMKGQLAIAFGERPRIESAVTARWLDLDMLFGDLSEDAKRTPLDLLSDLAARALVEASKLGDAAFSASIEQASLGGDLVGAVDLALASKGESITIERFSALLPGANRVTATGEISGSEKGPVFAGPVTLQGSELRPLLRWSAGDREMSGQTATGDFSLAAAVTLGGGRLQLANAEGKLSGTSFRGKLDYSGGDQRLIDLELDSDRLDLREMLGDGISWQAWLPAAKGEGAEGPDAERDLLAELRDDRAKVTLRVGELLLPDIPGGKLDADFTLAGDTLDVAQLNFAAPGSLSLNGKGRVESLSQAPAGGVNFALSAQTKEALSVATQLLGFSGSVTGSKHLGGLVPLDVQVGLVADRAGDATKASLEMTGMAGRSQLAITAHATGTPAKLGDAEMDFAGTLTGDKPQVMLGLLLPNLPEDRLAAAAGDGGTLSVTLRGVPNQNVTGRFGLETGAIKIAFDGNGALHDDGLALKGNGTAVTASAGLALALLGLEAPPSASDVPLDLSAAVTKTGQAVAIETVMGTIAGESVQGSARIDLSGARTKVSAKAEADYVNLASLLGTLIAWQRTPSTEEMLGSIGAGASAVWPSRGFALGPLERTEGDITLTAKTMSLGAPLEIRDATLNARLTSEGLSIADLKGGLFGGALVASGNLSPRGAGAMLSARADITDGKLEELSKGVAGKPLAKGPFSLRFDVTGEGLSPPGLVAGLSGEGALTLAAGTLQSFNPAPLQQVAASAKKKVKATKEQIEAQARTVRDKLTKGTYRYGATTIPFEVKNGTLRLSPTQLAGKGAAPTIGGYIELASLKLDSEWTVNMEGDLPAVSLVFAGPLDKAAEISPGIDTVAIESYLTMRRMKEDVERLETLDVTGKTKPQLDDDETAAPEPEAAPEPPHPKTPVQPDKVQMPAPPPAKPVPTVDAAPSQPVPPQSAPAPSADAAPAPAAPLPWSAGVPSDVAPPPEQSSINPQLPPLLDAEGNPIAVDPTLEAGTPVTPRPAPRQRRPRPAPDDWKKNIPIFGGG